MTDGVWANTVEAANKHPWIVYGGGGLLLLLMLWPRKQTAQPGQLSDQVKMALIQGDVQKSQIDAQQTLGEVQANTALKAAQAQYQAATRQTAITTRGMVSIEQLRNITQRMWQNIQRENYLNSLEFQSTWNQWANALREKELYVSRELGLADIGSRSSSTTATALRMLSDRGLLAPQPGFGQGFAQSFGYGIGQQTSNVAGDVLTGIVRLIAGIFSYGTSEIPHIAGAAQSSGNYYNSNFLEDYFRPSANRGW